MKVGLTIVTWVLIKFVLYFIIVNPVLSDEGYPHREKYPDINIISTADLKKQYDNVVIIDVRSRTEFNAVRIKKAILIPISSRNFEDNLKHQEDLISERKNKSHIVFYCNGHSCEKSYQATQKAKDAGIKNILCYVRWK